jgi:hypothetical protein
MLKKNADKSFEAVEIASPNGDRTQIKGKRSAGRLIMAELEAFGDALLRLFLRVVRIAARPQHLARIAREAIQQADALCFRRPLDRSGSGSYSAFPSARAIADDPPECTRECSLIGKTRLQGDISYRKIAG